MHLKERVLYSSKFCERRTENLMLLEGSCAKQVTQQPNVFLIFFYWGLSIAVFLGALQFDTEKETESTR